MMMSAYANILKVTDIDRLDRLHYIAEKLVTCVLCTALQYSEF